MANTIGTKRELPYVNPKQIGRVYNVSRAHYQMPRTDKFGALILDDEGQYIVDQPAYIVWNGELVLIPPPGHYTDVVVNAEGVPKRYLTLNEARKIANNHVGLSNLAPFVADPEETPVAKKAEKSAKTSKANSASVEPVEEETQKEGDE